MGVVMIEKLKNIKWRFIPICLLFGILPLIMRLNHLKVDPAYAKCLPNETYPDWFFLYKGVAFIFLTLFMLIGLLILRKQVEPHRDLAFKIYSISGLVFILGSMFSTFLSPYKDLAIIGGPTRFEGLGVILCYVMVMFYCYSVFEKTHDFKYLIIPLIFVVLVQTFVGFTQFIGYDFVQWKGIRDLIAPGEFEAYNYYSPGTEPWFPKTSKQWTALLGNRNYTGSFVSLCVPFFLAITLATENFKKRMSYWLVTFCGIYMAFASQSRAGFVGILLSLLLGVICLVCYIPRNMRNIKWGELVTALIVTLCLMFVTNADNRFSSLAKDISKFFNSASSSYDSSLENRVITTPIHRSIQSFELYSYKILIHTSKGTTLTVSLKDEQLKFTDSTLTPVDYTLKGDNLFIITSDPYKNYAFEKFTDETYTYIRFFDSLNQDTLSGTPKCGFRMDQSGNLVLTNYWNFEELSIVTAPSIGFEGKERLGSSRGYIWSRSLPLLKDTLLLGYGPDMFMLAFPQNDFWNKWEYLSNPFTCVDKPHNTYLQIWINQGLPALLSFLILCTIYILHSLKLYAFKKAYSLSEGLGIGFMMAIVGYLGASFFNDTTLSVTPLFWALLGAGMAYNVIYRKNKSDLLP